MAPQLRMTLDKMLVKVFSDQWQEMRSLQDNFNSTYGRWGNDIERVRGWAQDMEVSEKLFRGELFSARKQIEEGAELTMRPSRDLDDYSSVTTFPSLATLQTPTKNGPAKAENQGWLNLRTVTGKPSRTVWLRRWFFVKNGIFGWLVQGSRSGGVEESERIGVLLCSVRPSVTEDRRLCFEVKTKDRTIVVQAETQAELADWVTAFEVAKQKALEDPASTDTPGLQDTRGQDAAFAILSPTAPEFAASAADSGMQSLGDESFGTLPVPGTDLSPNLNMRNSFDVSSSRRSTVEGDSGRDHASRIIQKLDLHRKSTVNAQTTGAAAVASPTNAGVGGIASLIAASHNVMPIGPGVPPPAPDIPTTRPASGSSTQDLPFSTLAPNTLANPPAPTNLSSTAIIINGEKGIGMGRTDDTGGMPGGLMANVWGTTNWGYLNRLERGELKSPTRPKTSAPPSPQNRSLASPAKGNFSGTNETTNSMATDLPSTPRSSASHRKTISTDSDGNNNTPKGNVNRQEYPNYYPLQLKTQDAQFRLLFPNVRREERVVLVFRATWNLNDQQEFPGRVYVTAREMYFYSHYLGLVLISGISLASIVNVTAAPGRDSDFIFLHLKTNVNQTSFTRITIKTFLEPLKLLHKRLDFLVRNCNSDESLDLESIMKTLIKFEQDDPASDPSWDEISTNFPHNDGPLVKRSTSQSNQRDLRASVLIDRSLNRSGSNAGETKDVTKFQLPRQPVIYAPAGMDKAVVVKEFDISPKALFHVMFGDKSAVWQVLYHERQAQHIKQGSWVQPEQGHLRREFAYEISSNSVLGQQSQETIIDNQMVDVLNDHLCYVVTDRKTPFYLPSHTSFLLVSKIVITHVAKSKCRLAIYTKVDWLRSPGIMGRLVTNRALSDLASDAHDLADVIEEQVRKLGAHSRTKKAILIFGQVGQQTQVSEFTGSDAPSGVRTRRSMKRRTMTGLIFESVALMLGNVITTLLNWALVSLKWVWKTCDANSILLAVLAVSVLTNLFFTSWSTRDWYRERNAGKFMARLGVGPDLAMSRTLYLQDLDDATGYIDEVDDAPSMNQCRQTFEDLTSVSSPSPTSTNTCTARRLQSTRQNLGSYRHDLLVAMRVVNSIEREVVQAEYEDWLLLENRRCGQLREVIGANRTEFSGERLLEVSRWQGEYCDSCGVEERRVLGGEARL